MVEITDLQKPDYIDYVNAANFSSKTFCYDWKGIGVDGRGYLSGGGSISGAANDANWLMSMRIAL